MKFSLNGDQIKCQKKNELSYLGGKIDEKPIFGLYNPQKRILLIFKKKSFLNISIVY